MAKNIVTKNAVAGDKMALLDRVTPYDTEPDLDCGDPVESPSAPASITAKAAAKAKRIKNIINAKSAGSFIPSMRGNDDGLTESEEPDEDDEDEYEDDDEETVEESFSFMQRFNPELLNFGSDNLSEAFSTDEFSPELQEKLVTIFESVLKERTISILEEMDAYYQQTLEEQVEHISVVLSEKIDEKLNYVSYQWLEENQIAVESSLKTELTTEFMSGLKDLFETHYIDMPDEKYDVLSEMTDVIESLEQSLDEQIATNIELNTTLNEYVVADTVDEVGNGLSDVQKQRLYQLAEGISFDDRSQLKRKVSIIKESSFPQNPQYVITEDYLPTEVYSSSSMNKYSSALKK